jgi:hypothetical protein
MALPKGWKIRFLKALADTGNVRLACLSGGVERSWAYRTRDRDKTFGAAWEQALEDAADRLEAEAYRRAVQGVRRERPIFYQGRQVGAEMITEYSDGLLTLLLKAHRPERFKDRMSVSMKRDFSKLSEEELEVALSLARKLADD